MKDLTREQLEAFYADSLAINSTLRGENERLKKHVNDYAVENQHLQTENSELKCRIIDLNRQVQEHVVTINAAVKALDIGEQNGLTVAELKKCIGIAGSKAGA